MFNFQITRLIDQIRLGGTGLHHSSWTAQDMKSQRLKSGHFAQAKLTSPITLFSHGRNLLLTGKIYFIQIY